MKMTSCLMLLAVMMTASVAEARLGESKEECDKRYGNPNAQQTTPGSDKTLVYTKDGVRIVAEFQSNICQRISYRTFNPISEEEKKIFLRVNDATSALDVLMSGAHRGFSKDVNTSGKIGANRQTRLPRSGSVDYVHKTKPAKVCFDIYDLTFSYVDWDKAHENAIHAPNPNEIKAKQEQIKSLERNF